MKEVYGLWSTELDQSKFVYAEQFVYFSLDLRRVTSKHS